MTRHVCGRWQMELLYLYVKVTILETTYQHRTCPWQSAHKFLLLLASGHKDSVTCTGFSHDGKYVATADMGGLVQVWLTSSGEKVWSFEMGDIEVNLLLCMHKI